MNSPNLRKPADFDDLYPGRFLKAGQLGDRKPTVTIASVDVESLPDEKTGGERVRGVISFKEMPYQIVLNKTNGECLRALFGRELKGWVGKRVTLFRGKVESGSQRGTPAVRIWGSPEIDGDREVSIKMPRKAAFNITLHAVRRGDAQQSPQVERHPTEGQGDGGTRS